MAAESLSGHPGEDVTQALTGLLEDESCATPACWALRRHDSEQVCQRILSWAAADPRQERLAPAATALGGMTSPAATDALLRYAHHDNEFVRQAAVSALRQHSGAAVTTAQLGALADASHLVRHAAVRALQPRSGDPDVAAALLQRFSDPSPQVQEAAIREMQAADRSPEVTPALIARLSDDYDVVRRAAASVLQIASTPAPLLHLAALTALPAEPGLRALYGAAEMLAENVYRLLAREDRPAVLASLARLTDLAVQPEEPPEPSDTADPRPDSGFLETELVISVQGHNKQGDSVYSYIQLTGRSLRRLFAAMEAGVNFVPSDYGEVLAAGKGTPPPEVVKEMTEKYNMMETPFPEAAEDEGPTTGNPGFGRYVSPFLVDPGSDGME